MLCEYDLDSMNRQSSTIEISDVVDHNGAARYGFEDVGAPINDNAMIAPWIDEPVGIGVILTIWFFQASAFFD